MTAGFGGGAASVPPAFSSRLMMLVCFCNFANARAVRPSLDWALTSAPPASNNCTIASRPFAHAHINGVIRYSLEPRFGSALFFKSSSTKSAWPPSLAHPSGVLPTALVAPVDVGAVFEQHLGNIDVPRDGSFGKCGAARVVVHRIDVSALGEMGVDGGKITAGRSLAKLMRHEC